jgi:selenocysteine lyase/cysteine desulfurase
VLVPQEEFTSNLFPWMVQADRGPQVVSVPADRLCEAVDARTTVVTFSAVQSATGEVALYDELIARASTGRWSWSTRPRPAGVLPPVLAHR